jgi:mRNA interferase MazF
MKTKPGEVWLADLGLAAKSAYEADLGKPSFLREDSVANVQGLGSIPTQRLERKLDVISFDLLNQVKAALRFALEL